MRRSVFAVIFGLSIGLVACDQVVDGGGPCFPADADVLSCGQAYDGVPRVLGAFLGRMTAGSGSDALVTSPGPDGQSLLDKARGAVDGSDVETRRAKHAVDNAVRDFLGPFMVAANLSEWEATLPATQLTAEDVRQAGIRAQRLIDARLAGRAIQPWVAAYEAVASANLQAIHTVPGAPTEYWYGTPVVFQAVWDAALVIGIDAGDAAFADSIAAGATPEEAVGDAVNALLAANGPVFADITARKIAEANLLNGVGAAPRAEAHGPHCLVVVRAGGLGATHSPRSL